MRTPQDTAEDMLGRGRTLEQVRAVAVAMDNKDLRALVEKLIKERPVEVVKVKAEKV